VSLVKPTLRFLLRAKTKKNEVRGMVPYYVQKITNNYDAMNNDHV
jgi:hypothetical protein